MALRYGVGLPRFVINPLFLTECYAVIRRRINERDRNFLAHLRRTVYSNPYNPYYKLLQHAGCEYGDVEQMVAQVGLEKTLARLSDGGVYITVDEYKGKKPIERSGLWIQATPEDFDNPFVVPSLEGGSSGTRGARVRTKIDFEFLRDRAAQDAVQFDALEMYGSPYVFCMPTTRNVVCAAKARIPLVKWFLPLSSNRNRVASYYTIAIGRVFGCRLPWPSHVSYDQAGQIAAWLAGNKSAFSKIAVKAFPSAAVRVCRAAQENNLDIAGTQFITDGEPLTLAREKAIKSAGCRVVSQYASSETGTIGFGCTNSIGDDVHIFNGHIAVIQRPRYVGSSGTSVNALQVTSLLPSAPKVLINMENGDYGTLETRTCGCKFDSLGLMTHFNHIRSYEKLTSEGMTFFAGDLGHIIEEILPGKFGGGPLDYQAVEEENRTGISHLTVLVSPKVGDVDEGTVIRTILDEMAKSSRSSRMMARTWEEAGTVRIRREEPHPTKGGKVFSFQVETTHL
jgi:hypothetical protein